MNEQNVKKRGWVKNVAIIFLAVMLVLTFFSNTIMNRSLPEVAVQYTSSGTITARIRGSGTVTANETIEVDGPSQTLRIESRLVKVGDIVTRGQVLIKLSGSISDELDAAQTALNEAELALEIELINSPLVSNNVARALVAVQIARDGVSAAQRTLADAQRNLTDAQRVLSDIAYSEAAYNAAVAGNNNAQSIRNQALSILTEATRAANATLLNLERAEDYLESLGPPPDKGGTVDPVIYEEAVQKVTEADIANNIAQTTARAAGRDYTLAVESTQPAVDEFIKQSSSRDAWYSANSSVRSAQSGVDSAQQGVSSANISLNSANNDLTQAQIQDEVDGLLDSVTIRELRKTVEEKREALEILQKEGGLSEVVAPVDGKIISIAPGVEPGRNTDPAQPIMTIEVVDRGYSLTISATAQQASRVSVGDSAEVDRGWWGGSELFAVLTGIRPDPQNQPSGRLLHFAISGEDIESGNTLNVVMSQRSENYNIIVPNNALRQDTNGDFVLIVESRNSPLGSRFIAVRADVNILSSDDTNTAVSGALSGWDYVITTSSAPINPGDQVRLANN